MAAPRRRAARASSHRPLPPTPRQAAKLLATFRDFKRRQALGLEPFYRRRLAALEDALLAAREAMFASQEGAGRGDGGGGGGASPRAAALEGAELQPGLQAARQGARSAATLGARQERDQGASEDDKHAQVVWAAGGSTAAADLL
jgi:hypothetical protein